MSTVLRKLFLAVVAVSCNVFFYINYSAAGVNTSINLSPPQGYIEIASTSLPEYVAAMSAEAAYQSDVFLKFFIKEDEFPFVQSSSLDKLSSSITAVLAKKYYNMSSLEIKKQIIDENILTTFTREGNGKPLSATQTDSVKRAEKNTDKIFSIPDAKTISNRVASIKTIVINNTKIDVLPINSSKINEWLQKAKEFPAEDLELGVVRKEQGHTIYAWLQGTTGTFFSFGMPSSQPTLIAYAVIPVQKEKIGLIFANRISTAKDVVRHLDSISEYLSKSSTTFSITQGSLLPRVTSTFNVLSFQAPRLIAQGEIHQGITALKQLSKQYNEISLCTDSELAESLMLDTLVQIGECYAYLEDYSTLVNEIRPKLSNISQSQAMSEQMLLLNEVMAFSYLMLEDEENSSLFIQKMIDGINQIYGPATAEYSEKTTSIGTLYLALGKYTDAKQWLTKALSSAIKIHPADSEIVITIERELACALTLAGETGNAQKILKNSLLKSTSIGNKMLTAEIHKEICINYDVKLTCPI